MRTTGIRLEVEPWLYDVFVEEQEQRRLKFGRKYSLSSIILEFCLKGLTVSGYSVQDTPRSVQKNGNSVQNIDGFVQNNAAPNTQLLHTNLDEMAKMKENLLREEQELQEKTRQLLIKEQKIQERENVLVDKTQKAFQQWNELLDSKEQLQFKRLDKTEQNVKSEYHNRELTEKAEIIKGLKLENVRLKEDIVKVLRKIDHQTEKNILFDYIIPFLPSVVSIIGFFLTNRKIDNIQELTPIQNEIGDIMKKLSGEDRKSLSEKLKISLDMFSVKQHSD